MVYSCAYFENGDEDLATAQVAKLDHICRKLQLAPGQRLLDIGCGWGALAIHAAQPLRRARRRHHAVQRTSTSWPASACAAAGLQDRVEIRLQDYRDVPGEGGFDRISSIGMFEHVGLKNLGGYFDTVARLLKPGGVTLNHGITSSDPDSRIGRARARANSSTATCSRTANCRTYRSRSASCRAAGLELTDAESLRRHYAKNTVVLVGRLRAATSARWRRWPATRRARIWRIYLAGCAHAFAHGWINIYQLLAVKPAAATVRRAQSAAAVARLHVRARAEPRSTLDGRVPLGYAERRRGRLPARGRACLPGRPDQAHRPHALDRGHEVERHRRSATSGRRRAP